MKTTIELPDALLKQVKIRAVREGRKLKDAIADLLRKGLTVAEPGPRDPVVVKDKTTGLPLILCNRTPTPDEVLTPEQIDEIFLAEEAEWMA